MGVSTYPTTYYEYALGVCGQVILSFVAPLVFSHLVYGVSLARPDLVQKYLGTWTQHPSVVRVFLHAYTLLSYATYVVSWVMLSCLVLLAVGFGHVHWAAGTVLISTMLIMALWYKVIDFDRSKKYGSMLDHLVSGRSTYSLIEMGTMMTETKKGKTHINHPILDEDEGGDEDNKHEGEVDERGDDIEHAPSADSISSPDSHHQQDDMRTRLLNILQSYLDTAPTSLRSRMRLFVVSLVAFIVVSFVACYISVGLCVEVQPTSYSTAFTRYFQPSYCPNGEICHFYFTVPDDLSTSLIASFHSSTKPTKPTLGRWLKTYSLFSGLCLFGTSSHKELLVKQDIDQLRLAYGGLANASYIRVTGIEEEERYVSSCDLSPLAANTTYYVVGMFFDQQGEPVFSSDELKVRTAPANRTSSYSFVTGGDMSMDEANMMLMQEAAKTEPLFAMVGGDIAYDNAFPQCYRRWDRWFVRWRDYLTTPLGYSVPMLLAIGNHEAGGFMVQPQDILYYSAYFPHALGSGTVDVLERKTYHRHNIGRSVTILSLDSWVVTPMADQVDFIRSNLQDATSNGVPFTLAIYHASLYPSVPSWEHLIVTDGRLYWEPLFSSLGLTAAFENHYHVYKRTFPIRNGHLVGDGDGDGVVYLGDGAWGIQGTDIPIVKDSWWIDKIEPVPFIYKVTVNDGGSDDDNQGNISNDRKLYVEAIGLDGPVFDTWTKYRP
eukprot:TRINITY_DN4333_c0_g1_i4.p1 TRINITY_DN4333_c0_g1~~TRINITY_DN4333_c0_g1_i4.p1  ORF type:complete len:717 (-),score=100.73 TRINITY_DN4333_c0_g1_i4:37-2187(-)